MLKRFFDKALGRSDRDPNAELLMLAGQEDLCRQSEVPVFERLLRQGANPDYMGEVGKTPLLRAITSGNVIAVDILLHHGADPDAVDHWGRTPLGSAQAHLQWHQALPASDPRKTRISFDRVAACVDMLKTASRRKREKAMTEISMRHTKKLHHLHRWKRRPLP